MKIYVCRFDSTNFSFEAYGETRQEAIMAFATGIRRHADKYGADQRWVDEAVTETEPRAVETGGFYRDLEKA